MPNLPQPEVTHPLVNDLFDGVQQILGDNLLGFYLGGSLAIGDFDEDRSDLDFLVVAKGEFTDGSIRRLHELHDSVYASNKNRLYTNYEGIYLTSDQSTHPKTADMHAPHLGSDGHFQIEDHGADIIIDLWKIRKSGFVVYGPSPRDVIGEITTDDMLQAKIQLFKGWWLPKLQAKEPMDNEYQAYAILTMARILYGIENRDEVSKKRAAVWCAERYPQYTELLREALAWEMGDPLNKQGETYDLIRFVAERV
ncbi:MAG TPA: aminoglycoside adenylyltransferase domain-containing protein [Candidatus Chromulinivoraceae bacterium]|nr:aminoglycoside adenylyltransferase domain-containing protein [Candidatus Chromulinivoraceae bacterium]